MMHMVGIVRQVAGMFPKRGAIRIFAFRLEILALLLISVGCGGRGWTHEDLRREPGRTEVTYLGTLHGPLGHRSDGEYTHEDLGRFVRNSAPDVIFLEIPPQRFDDVRAGRDAEWLAAFPELPMLFEVAQELDAEVVPVSGWTSAATAAHRLYWGENPDGPEEAGYQAAAGQLSRLLDEFGEAPEWIHGPRYLRMTAWRDRALNSYAAHALGAAAPQYIYPRHGQRIGEALAAHQGKRITIVFDARRRWFVEEMVREQAHWLDPRAFLHD